MPPSQHLRWIRPPRQARSQQTLERVLDAAEALIAEQGIDHTTVAEIARRAESSVGAIYARFGDKEALLRSVFERFYEQAVATADHVFDPKHWLGVPLGELLHSAISLTLRIFRERRLLFAGFTVRAASDPKLQALGERLGLAVAERATTFLQQRGETISHPDPDLAVRFGVFVVLSALEARALYSPQAVQDVSEAVMAAELTRMCLGYLGLAAPEPS